MKTHVLALGDGGQVDLDLGHGQDVGGSGHVDEEFCIRPLVSHRFGNISQFEPQLISRYPETLSSSSVLPIGRPCFPDLVTYPEQ